MTISPVSRATQTVPGGRAAVRVGTGRAGQCSPMSVPNSSAGPGRHLAGALLAHDPGPSIVSPDTPRTFRFASAV